MLISQHANAEETPWRTLLEKGKFSERWETTGNWSVDRQGSVTLAPRKGETGWRRFSAYLWSKDRLKDFEVQFEYRLQKKGNSGFYFHVNEKDSPVATGLEVQLFDSFGKPAASKLTDHDSGGIIPGIPPIVSSPRAAGEWNHFRVRVENNRVKIWLNEQLVNDVPLDHPSIKDRPREGYIGFQDHGMPLSLRSVRFRAL